MELCSLQKRADNSAFLLQISGYSGDAGDSWGASHNLNGMAFTTRDNDNDNMRVDCALNFKGSVVNFAKFNDASLYSRGSFSLCLKNLHNLFGSGI